jgi:uncharacterized phage protein gp47/JayE
MPITIPTLDATHDRIIEDYRGYFPDDDISNLSDNWKRTRVLAGAVWSLLYNVDVVQDDLMPDTAAGDFLDRIGVVYGVTRLGATPARKSDALRITGTNGSTVTVGEQLTHTSGLIFQVNENATIPGALFVDVDVIGVSTGEQTKLQAGEILTFGSPPSGIDATAELQLDLDEDGTDQESDGAYRVRILNQIAQPSMGGNANDYRQWAIGETGIASAYVYPLRRGRGSVDLAALHAGRGSVRLLTSQEITDLEEAIDLLRPVAMEMFRVLEVTSQEQDIDVQIKELPGYLWDWDESGGPYQVVAWTAATRLITMSPDRPDDMRAGDRIVLRTAVTNGTGQQYTVEAIGPASNQFSLTETPVPAPASPDVIHSGGDLTDTVRNAILAFMDALGPAIGTTGVGDWIDEIEPEHLLAIALQQTGVRNGNVVKPATTVTPDDPAFPNDDEIEVLIPGEVVVRRLF